MPGLVGFVKDLDSSQAGAFLWEMSKALEPAERFTRHNHYESGMGLGRVSLGILNPEPQPVWSEAQDVCLFMEGEIYNHKDLQQSLTDKGYRFNGNHDAEIALYSYLEYGDEFASGMRGAFVIALWDRNRRKLLITNDRLGLYPVYYAQTGTEFVFGSGVRALLADRTLPREVDAGAMAQFLTFDHVLHNRTLLAKVKLMDQASVLTFQDGLLQMKPYWSLRYTTIYPLRNEDEYVEELMFLMRRSIEQQAKGSVSSGLLLSGGLDSRVLLGLMADNDQSGQLQTFTWGIPGCDDARIAKELAKAVGAQHHFFELKPDWLLDQANEAVRLTDGMGNVVNLHALATLEHESHLADVIYKGFLGDAMFGFAIRPRFWADYDDANRIQAHWDTHRDQGVIMLELAQQQELFTNEFRQMVGDAVLTDYRAGMNEPESKQLAVQRLHFDLRQRVPRMTIKGVEVVRSRVAVRLPFCDYDLIDFSTQVPPGYLQNRHIVSRGFYETYPKLAKIPSTTTDNLPMVACAREVYLRAMNLGKWHLRNRGLGRLAGPQKRPYKNYDLWFRTVLRTWVEETLLSEQCLNRGYFEPAYIRNLVTEHMNGANLAVRLGGLLSIELWHQQFIDG